MRTQPEAGEPRRLLAVLAHPDDESFGPGGTLARYAAEGAEVYLITATRGEEGKLHGRNPPFTRATMGQIRADELGCAAGHLGIKRWLFLGYEDGTLSRVPRKRLVELIVRFIRTWRPQVVITFPPDGLTGHPDHVAISGAASEAFSAAGRNGAFPHHKQEGLDPYAPAKLYHFVVPASAAPRHREAVIGTPDEYVTTVVDCSAAFGERQRAIRCHVSQLPERPARKSSHSGLATAKRGRPGHTEHFILAASRVKREPGRESDLFANISPAAVAGGRNGGGQGSVQDAAVLAGETEE